MTVTPVAGSNDHEFTISFPTQTAAGTYTLTVGPGIQDWYGNEMNQNRNGVNGEASRRVRRRPSAPARPTLLKRDTTTQGNWIGTYGSQGYNIIGNAASYPAYATVTPTGQSTYTWAASTTDPRGLQTPAAPAASPPSGTPLPASRST